LTLTFRLEPVDIEEAELDAVMAGSILEFGIVVRSLAPALERVTMLQYRILLLVHAHGPMRNTDLASEVGLLPSGVTRIVSRLVRDGYATRRTAEESRREVFVHPTPRGAALVEDVLARRRDEYRGILRRLSIAERSSLVAASKALTRAVDTRPGSEADLFR
jgi:DNA-binding MarR family transcriptional regulator